MNRRRFIKLAAMAGAALGLGSRAEAQPPPKVKPDLPPRKLYMLMEQRPPVTVLGDGTGQQWILDPTCPRDKIYSFNLRDFPPQEQDDAKMYHAFARYHFQQPPREFIRNARVINLEAPGDIDAL